MALEQSGERRFVPPGNKALQELAVGQVADAPGAEQLAEVL
jgi:hypothetical protein